MYRRFQCPFAVDTLPIGLSLIFTGTSLSPISMIPWKCVCRNGGGVSYYADRRCLSTMVQKQPFTQMFLKIGVLKSFTMFTVKHLCQSLFLIKLQTRSLKSCNFIKKRLQHRCFPVKNHDDIWSLLPCFDMSIAFWMNGFQNCCCYLPFLIFGYNFVVFFRFVFILFLWLFWFPFQYLMVCFELLVIISIAKNYTED